MSSSLYQSNSGTYGTSLAWRIADAASGNHAPVDFNLKIGRGMALVAFRCTSDQKRSVPDFAREAAICSSAQFSLTGEFGPEHPDFYLD